MIERKRKMAATSKISNLYNFIFCWFLPFRGNKRVIVMVALVIFLVFTTFMYSPVIEKKYRPNSQTTDSGEKKQRMSDSHRLVHEAIKDLPPIGEKRAVEPLPRVMEVVKEDVWKGEEGGGCVGLEYLSKSSYIYEDHVNTHSRLSCIVEATAKSLRETVEFMRQAWLKSCDEIILTSRDDLRAAAAAAGDKLKEMRALMERISVWVLQVDDSWPGDSVAEKTWVYVAHRLLNRTDFFVYARDDAFLLMNNIRPFLLYLDPDQPLYLGHVMCEPRQRLLYNQAYAHILTAAASHLLAEEIQAGRCHTEGPSEDWALASCLHRAGVLPSDTSDPRGRERFLPHELGALLDEDYHDVNSLLLWTHNTVERRGKDPCCSQRPFSFPNVTGSAQLEYHYLFIMTRKPGRPEL